MTAAEIAETLCNGNIALARDHMLRGRHSADRTAYDAATLALDVVGELELLITGCSDGISYAAALRRVRRCLEGAP